MGRRGGGGWWIARRGDGTRCFSAFERAVVALVFGGRTKLFVEESAEATGRYPAYHCFYQVSTAIIQVVRRKIFLFPFGYGSFFFRGDQRGITV